MPRKKSAAANLRKRNLQRLESTPVREKGMELPVNTLVIVAIAVIVILAIAAFFLGGFGGSSKDVQNRQAFLNSCSAWTQSGCNNDDYDSSIKDTFLVWQPIQKEQLDGKSDPEQKDYLASKCGCFGAGTGGRSSTKPPCDQLVDNTNGKSGGCLPSTTCKDSTVGVTEYTATQIAAGSCPSGEVCCQLTPKATTPTGGTGSGGNNPPP